MRIVDGTDRLLRAPTTTFRAAEVGLDAFGYNFPNRALTGILEEAAAGEGNITRFTDMAESIDISAEAVSIRLAGGETLSADFAVGADGRGSKLRETSGITVRNWSYPQSAMVLNFAHSLPHQNISTEFHTKHGPFTQCRCREAAPASSGCRIPLRQRAVWNCRLPISALSSRRACSPCSAR